MAFLNDGIEKLYNTENQYDRVQYEYSFLLFFFFIFLTSDEVQRHEFQLNIELKFWMLLYFKFGNNH